MAVFAVVNLVNSVIEGRGLNVKLDIDARIIKT